MFTRKSSPFIVGSERRELFSQELVSYWLLRRLFVSVWHYLRECNNKEWHRYDKIYIVRSRDICPLPRTASWEEILSPFVYVGRPQSKQK